MLAFPAEIVDIRSLNDHSRSSPLLVENELDELFYLQRFTSEAEYYLGSGSNGDTMCVVFKPLAPCSLYFAELEWYTDGPIHTYLWEYSDEANEMFPDGRGPNRGMSPVSILGDVLAG